MIKFKLQKLLDIREKEEEESKLKYTQAQNKKRFVENNLRNLEGNYKKYSDISNICDVVTQKVTINYLSSLSQSIKETSNQLEKEIIKTDKAKEDFIQKQIKRKTLEKLKENEIERIREEEARIEQITNDEFALYAYIRNRANFL